MKKSFLMGVALYMLTSCGSDIPESPQPSYGPDVETPEQDIQKPVDKKNPSISDYLKIHEELEAGLKGNSKLEDILKSWNLVSHEIKDGKYILKWTDGKCSVLDLNDYTLAEPYSVGDKQSRNALDGVEDIQFLSNSKVLVWSPLEMDEKIITLLKQYNYEKDITVLTGPSCTWQALVGLGEYATVILHSMAVDGWLSTGQEYDERMGDSGNGNMTGIYSTKVGGELKHFYMINPDFVKTAVLPVMERGMVFNASSDGAVGDGWVDAFAQAGFKSYVGFDNLTDMTNSMSKLETFFTNLLKERLSLGESMDNEVSAPFEIKDKDGKTVKTTCKISGCTDLYSPYTGVTDSMAVCRILEIGGKQPDYYNQLFANKKLFKDLDGRLNIVDLSGLGLTGEIPSCISWLTAAMMINLGNNEYTGEIPESLGSIASLISLGLNDNKLTGNVPKSFAELYERQVQVNLSDNKLEGEIPFGQYADMNYMFTFDRRYQYRPDGKVIDLGKGLWFSDEPVEN